MILTSFLVFCSGIIIALISIFNIPHIPLEIMASFRSYINLIANNLSLIGLLFRQNTFVSFCAVAIVLINFEHIYEFVIYVYHKLFNRL